MATRRTPAGPTAVDAACSGAVEVPAAFVADFLADAFVAAFAVEGEDPGRLLRFCLRADGLRCEEVRLG